MFLRSIATPVKSIKGIGDRYASNLFKLGITKASELLLHYPRNWEDRTRIVPISEYKSAKVCTVVTVLARDWFSYHGEKRLKIYVKDESAQGVLLFFSPYVKDDFLSGEKYRLFGTFTYNRKYSQIQSSSFEIEPFSTNDNFKKIMPIYPLTAGIKMAAMRNFILNALKSYVNEIENELPSYIIERDNLLSKKEAIKEIHSPTSLDALFRAKKTIIYEELFYLAIVVGKRSFVRRAIKSLSISDNKKQKKDFSPLQLKLLERLPFKLTEGQRLSIEDINADMESPYPMARLLQGDVGSGKTLVSFLAALKAVEKREQAAIMAPTELLARQHAENAARLLEPLGCRIAFLTGNIKSAGRRELLSNLKLGDIDIIVGTHALFSKDVEYKKLKLVVIDEQHRFGVMQRALIMSKGEAPNLLMMSATPIPRTLVLTVFGDMDVSTIKDLPSGRKPINTHLAKVSNEKKVYDFVRKELQKGRQAYFVYPLIEDGDEIKDAVSMAEKLSKKIFPKFKTALIHSKVEEEEKRRIMDDFRKGEIKVLAATSVVEVGVDVPNATCMVIEHAERFGLSALHQLRGRVGRGMEQSYCFLVYSDDLTDIGKLRLKVMLENSDGFLIAEEDLKMRGPGLIAGTEQSGFLELGLAKPIRDSQELLRAREDAFSILENDPDLLLENNRVIARVLEEAPPFSDAAL